MTLGLDITPERPWRLEVLGEALEQCRYGGEAESIAADLRRSYAYQARLGRVGAGRIPQVYAEGFAMCEARRAELAAAAAGRPGAFPDGKME